MAISTTPAANSSPSSAVRTGMSSCSPSQRAKLLAKCSSMCCTTTTAQPRGGTQPASILETATGPPVEAPIASSDVTGTGVSALSATGAGALPASDVRGAMAWLPPLWRISLSMVRILASSSESPPGWPCSTGVAVTSSAPAPSARNTWLTLSCGRPVTTRIAHGLCSMILRVASTPSSSGMLRSMRIRSGRFSAHMRTASAPVRAIHSTWCSAVLATTRRSASAAMATSLAMAIFICGRLQSGR